MNSNLLFYLYPYTHINIKDKILLCNTLTGEHFTEEKEKVKILIQELLNHPNKTLILEQGFINNPEISDFMEKIKNFNMGDLIETGHSKKQPVQLMHDLKIQKGVEFLKSRESQTIGQEILNYLSDVTIFLNNTCSLNCKSCNYDYKQTISCKQYGSNKELDLKLLLQQLDFFNQIPIDTLHVTGGNLFSYYGFQDILNHLTSTQFKSVIYINSINFLDNWDLMKNKNIQDITFNILVNNYSNLNLKKLAHILSNNFSNYILTFLVESEEQYKKIEEFNKSINLQETDIKAIYNGNNLHFFEENVFIDKEIIFEEKQCLKDITRKQGVNANFFGKIVIDNDGEVYSNIIGKSLGNIASISVQELIERELSDNQYWRLLRTDVQICSDCCYNILCPEISNYELILNKYNLCHIKNN